MLTYYLKKHLNILIFGSVYLLLVLTSATGFEEKLKEFDQFIKHTLKCRNVPSLSVSLVKDDEVVFSRGYGFADIEKQVKATEHTKFCIGSLTKAFTTTLLADILSKNSSLSWDSRVRDILGPRFEFSDRIRTDNANIRDLLAHKIGTPSNFHPLLVGFPANTSKSELVERIQYMPACSEFRQKFHYSNYMYMLAGHMAERITGESWENLVTSRLLEKLCMRSTGFVDSGEDLSEIAQPCASRNNTLVPVDKRLLLAVSPSGPAGSIYSTASDMAKWMLFHLRHGRTGHGEQLVSQDWLKETYDSQMTHPFQEKDLTRPVYPIGDATISYNLGWMTSMYRGYRKLWHSGGIVTFVSQLWMFPEINVGVFVSTSGPMSSRGSAAVKSVAAQASDLLLGLEPWLNMSTVCTFPDPWEKPSNHTLALPEIGFPWNISRPASDYEGIYGHLGFGNITVYAQETNRLSLEYGRFGKMKLFPLSESDFLAYYTDLLWFMTNSDGNTIPIRLKFVNDSNGDVTGLLFPVDFQSNSTLFLRGQQNNEKQTISVSPSDVNTSDLCTSGAWFAVTRSRGCVSTAVLCVVIAWCLLSWKPD